MRRGVKSYLFKMQQGVKSKKLWELPWVHKGTIQENSPSSQLLFDSPLLDYCLTPLCIKQRGVKFQIKKTPQMCNKTFTKFMIWIRDKCTYDSTLLQGQAHPQFLGKLARKVFIILLTKQMFRVFSELTNFNIMAF